MAKFTITCMRVVRETDTQRIEAPTLADALKIAHAAYCEGAAEDRPYSYGWEDCGDVEEIEFQHRDANDEIQETASFVQAELGEFDPAPEQVKL